MPFNDQNVLIPHLMQRLITIIIRHLQKLIEIFSLYCVQKFLVLA